MYFGHVCCVFGEQKTYTAHRNIKSTNSGFVFSCDTSANKEQKRKKIESQKKRSAAAATCVFYVPATAREGNVEDFFAAF